MNWFNQCKNSVWHPYSQMNDDFFPIKVKKTKGSYIYQEGKKKDFPQGNFKLVDAIASWWSCAHGYNHPYITKAMKKQLKKMPHIMFGSIAHEPAYIASQKLVDFIADDKLKKVFFADSGSVAVEIAMKMACQYYKNANLESTKTKFLTLGNAYHGDTMGAMSLCDPVEGMHGKFDGFFPRQLHHSIPKTEQEFNQFDKFLSSQKNNIACLFIEPLIQCAGGFNLISKEQIYKIFKIAKKYEILFACDECVTGFYRTGGKFAYQECQIKPDFLILGKALTGGFITMAAVITSEEIFHSFQVSKETVFMHGPTYMANPLAASAVCASIDLFQREHYKEKVQNINTILHKLNILNQTQREEIIKIDIKGAIASVRVQNMDLQLLRDHFLAKGVFLRPMPYNDYICIYIMPNFNISVQDLNKIIDSVLELFAVC